VSLYLIETRRVQPGAGPTFLAAAERAWRGLAAHRDRVMFFRLAVAQHDPNYLLTLIRYRDRTEYERLLAAVPAATREELARPILPGTLKHTWAEAVRDIDNFTYDSGFVSILRWQVPSELVGLFVGVTRTIQDRFMAVPGTVASRLLRADGSDFVLVSEYRDAAALEAVLAARITADVPQALRDLKRTAFSGSVRLSNEPPSRPMR
jgi:hypothetical protein